MTSSLVGPEGGEWLKKGREGVFCGRLSSEEDLLRDMRGGLGGAAAKATFKVDPVLHVRVCDLLIGLSVSDSNAFVTLIFFSVLSNVGRVGVSALLGSPVASSVA